MSKEAGRLDQLELFGTGQSDTVSKSPVARFLQYEIREGREASEAGVPCWKRLPRFDLAHTLHVHTLPQGQQRRRAIYVG